MIKSGKNELYRVYDNKLVKKSVFCERIKNVHILSYNTDNAFITTITLRSIIILCMNFHIRWNAIIEKVLNKIDVIRRLMYKFYFVS